MEDDDGEHRRADQTLDGSPDNAASDSTGGADDAYSDLAETEREPVYYAYTTTAVSAFSGGGGGGVSHNYFLPGGVTYVGTHGHVGAYGYYTIQVGTPHSAQEKTVEHGGVKLGEIEAWRCWVVVGDMLKAVAMDTIWDPEKPMDGDLQYGGGVHAWKTRAQAARYYGLSGAIGRVKLWGEIIEHEYGYRAEHAKIIELVSCPEGPEKLHNLRLTYGLGDDGWKRRAMHITWSASKLSNWMTAVNIVFQLLCLSLTALHAVLK